jgi:hypothetical protein
VPAGTIDALHQPAETLIASGAAVVRAEKRQLSPRPGGNAEQQYVRTLIRQSPELVQHVAP